MSLFASLLQFIRDPQNDFLGHTGDTLRMSLLSIVLAILLGAPIGVLVARRPVAAFVAASIAGVARAVPVLAFIVFLYAVVPFFHVGLTIPVIVLTLLGIPPILLNTISGLRGIDPAVVDAGRGMGMTPWQILTRIQLPLVLPVLAAGIRTAAVQIVATSPLSSIIGAGGYGEYITAGLSNLADPTELLAGGLAIALLALLTEVVLARLQRIVTPVGVRQAAPQEAVEEEGIEAQAA
ncbi:MAG TPA: ABC transporter permease [Ktedonobacterales bacterium]